MRRGKIIELIRREIAAARALDRVLQLSKPPTAQELDDMNRTATNKAGHVMPPRRQYTGMPPMFIGEAEIIRLKDLEIKRLNAKTAELKEMVERRDRHIDQLHFQRSVQDKTNDRIVSLQQDESKRADRAESRVKQQDVRIRQLQDACEILRGRMASTPTIDPRLIVRLRNLADMLYARGILSESKLVSDAIEYLEHPLYTVTPTPPMPAETRYIIENLRDIRNHKVRRHSPLNMPTFQQGDIQRGYLLEAMEEIRSHYAKEPQ